MSFGHPPAEAEIDEALVRDLLTEQFPELAPEPLELIGNGWDNSIYRLGREHLVRVPRREVAAQLVLNEQRWLSELAPRLPLPIPVPTHCGVPSDTYPWPWSVCPWFEGERASASPPSNLREAAETLAEFVNALHTTAPADAPVNPVRGGPHVDRIDRIADRIEGSGAVGHLPADADADKLVELWLRLASAPAWEGTPVWLHGDLHGSNILTRDGRLSAVIDFGDITAGDPATDLAVAWIVLDQSGRDRFRDLVAADDATWTRAEAWALSFAVMYLDSRDTDPVMGRMGEHTLTQVLAGQKT